MSNYLDQIIVCLQTESDKEKLQDCIGSAGDLLGGLRSKNYVSGFPEIDSENLAVEDGEIIKQTLIDLTNRITDADIVKSVIWALRKSGDSSLKNLYIEYLQKYLQMLLLYNSGVFQILLALGDIDEDTFEWDLDLSSEFTTQSLMEVDKNIRQARSYLEKNNIVVPW
jgi:hypothetical protein